MYKGWIKCNEQFQRMSGFKYKGKQVRHGGKIKYFDVELTDVQYQGIKENWEKFKSINIEWNLEKKVDKVNGLQEGETVLNLLRKDSYFFYKYENLRKFSILQEWKTYNGLHYINDGMEVKEGYRANVSHITDSGKFYDKTTRWIESNVKAHSHDLDSLGEYIKNLLDIKNQLKDLNKN